MRAPRIHSALTRLLAAAPAGVAVLWLACGTPGFGQRHAEARDVGPGTRVLAWSRPEGPHALYAVEADLSNPLLRLAVVNGKGPELGLETTAAQARWLEAPGRIPVAGVNGDFFYYPSSQSPGIPTNAAVAEGELIRTPFRRPCLVIGADGALAFRTLTARGVLTLPGGVTVPLDQVNGILGRNQAVLYTPRFGGRTRASAGAREWVLQPATFPLQHDAEQRATVREVATVANGGGGAAIPPQGWVLSATGPAAARLEALTPGTELTLRVDFDPPLRPGDQVVGGSGMLLQQGNVIVEPANGNLGNGFATTRHPRTAVGVRGRTLYLVVVDGRRPGISVGMSLHELAEVMRELGCTDALNLDGGGSTTFWVRGTTENMPSDGRERAVANSLFVVSSAPREAPVRLVVRPATRYAMPGARLPVTVVAEDRHHNPTDVPAEALEWTVPAGTSAAGSAVLLGAEAAGPLTLRATWQGLTGETVVHAVTQPARVEVLPPIVRVRPGGTTRLRVRAFDEAGRPLLLPVEPAWTPTGSVGRLEPGSVFVAADRPASGTLELALGGKKVSLPVQVSEAAEGILEDFEGRPDWRQSVLPAGLLATAQVVGGTVRSGKQALRLQYDFASAGGTRALYATRTLDLGAAFALRAWVYGDGQGAWLRARVRDAGGEARLIDLARRVDWSGEWREVRAAFSDDWKPPLRLEALYLVETDANRKPRGILWIDDLTLER